MNLHRGLKGVDWLTILSDRWLERLGGLERVKAEMGELPVLDYDGGAILRAGSMPQLGDNEHPEANAALADYRRVAAIIEPVRIKDHPGIHPRLSPSYRHEKRFGAQEYQAWLARFSPKGGSSERYTIEWRGLSAGVVPWSALSRYRPGAGRGRRHGHPRHLPRWRLVAAVGYHPLLGAGDHGLWPLVDRELAGERLLPMFHTLELIERGEPWRLRGRAGERNAVVELRAEITAITWHAADA